MKSIFSDLFFDRQLVSQIKEVKIHEALLYHQLMTGKITMREYLQAL